ncbi:MAG: cytochrome c oxidase subunit, partial [Solirubrobacteraceae bacterium]|nr:cytochrome c oxidase subunit [Solirubrobacteraceae bacterium]
MTIAARLRAPGWYRAALSVPIGIAVGFGIDVGVRALYGWHPLIKTDPIVTVCLISVPLAFLVGIGCFDYWFRWASGAPTIPEDHSGHGARGWRDYFRVNTDHKVIGLQYICTTFVFFSIGGLLAMISTPLAFLVGIGCFDYWFRWASGAPTVPDDHSSHGAHTWKDYFRVNTDHKVIGIQFIVTTFFFFIAGGLMAMVMRAELAQPGTQFVD